MEKEKKKKASSILRIEGDFWDWNNKDYFSNSLYIAFASYSFFFFF